MIGQLRALGVNIRVNRKRWGLSQMALADDAELHRTYIADLERGVRNPSIVSLLKISRAMRITVSELCRGIEKGSGTAPKRGEKV